jgi:hypothetical protein
MTDDATFTEYRCPKCGMKFCPPPNATTGTALQLPIRAPLQIPAGSVIEGNVLYLPVGYYVCRCGLKQAAPEFNFLE